MRTSQLHARLLNFIFGLWSCCDKEQIIVFTTNDKHSLEPALLRPGRMDMHVHMAYCTISAFKQLAINYHGISYHHLYGEIEGLITEVKGDPLKKLQETYWRAKMLKVLFKASSSSFRTRKLSMKRLKLQGSQRRPRRRNRQAIYMVMQKK